VDQKQRFNLLHHLFSFKKAFAFQSDIKSD